MTRKPTDDEFRDYLARYETYLSRDERYGLLIDVAPAVGMISVGQARMQAEWMKSNGPRLRERCWGVAFLLPSAVHRGVLKAIFKMQPIPTNYTVVGSIEEAEAWISQMAPSSAA
jgi:hypothetical protein